MAEAPSKIRRIRVAVRDIGGVQDATVELESGRVNVLQGPNGIGKTSLLRAFVGALGGDTAGLEVRDGAPFGSIDVTPEGSAGEGEEGGSFRVVVPAHGRLRQQGEAPLQAAEVKAVGSLITGDHLVSQAARDRRRLDAFLSIVRPAVDADAVRILCEGDLEAMARLSSRIDSGQVRDLLGAAEDLKAWLMEQAREREKAAAAWTGQEKAANDAAQSLLAELKGLGLEEPEPAPKPAEMRAAVEARLLALNKAETGRDRRRAVEAQQEAIRAASTPRPDVSGAEEVVRGFIADVQAAREEVVSLGLQIVELQEKQRAAQERADKARADGKAAEARWQDLQAQAAAWDAQQALLAQEVTGETDADVEAASRALDSARVQEEIHRLSSEMLAVRAAADEAARQRSREETRGKQLRAWSAAVPARVADVLAREGAGGFTIQGGRLAYTLGGEVRDFDSRLSPGQQVAAALSLAASRWKGFVHLDGDFYSRLDTAGKLAVDQFAAEHPEYFVSTEEPTGGSSVTAEHGVEAAEAARRAAFDAAVAAARRGEEEQ